MAVVRNNELPKTRRWSWCRQDASARNSFMVKRFSRSLTSIFLYKSDPQDEICELCKQTYRKIIQKKLLRNKKKKVFG